MDVRMPSVQGGADGAAILRFGLFELDLRTCELRRSGALVKLQQQPFKVLTVLACHAGELVTRERLRREVWGGDTYVDFDQGLNFCIKQIRAALGDQAETPRYIETLPRRGYRFIAPLEPTHPARQPVPLPFPAVAEPRPRAAGRGLPWSRRPWRWAAAGALALVLAVTGFAVGRAGAVAPAPEFTRLTFSRGYVEGARFGAEGEVFYLAAWNGTEPELFATRRGALDTRAVGVRGARLAGVAGAEAAVRRRVEGRSSTLARVPVAGGALRDVAEDVAAADWARDGSVFAAVRTVDERPRLEFPLGNVLPEALQARTTFLRISPDGQRLAFLEHPVPDDDRGLVVTVDRAGRRRVLSADWASLEGLSWSADGREVWFTGTRLGADSSLWAVGLDGRERLVYRAPGRLVVHDVAPDGRVLLARNTVRMEMRARWAGEENERDLSWLDLPALAGLSGDGRSVLFGESGEAGGPGYTIFLRRQGSLPMRLGEGRPMALSADGRWVASLPVTPPFRVVLIPTGAGASRTVTPGRLEEITLAGFTPDARSLVVAAREPGRPARLFLLPLEGGAPRPVTPEGCSARRIVISPDGQWVVACTPGQAPALHPLAGGAPRPVPGLTGEDYPLQWSADGRALFVERGRLPVQVHRIDLLSGRREPWRELAPEDRAGVHMVSRLVMSPDGQTYAFGYHRGLSELYLVEGLR